ncbi:MAG: GNAT family N-acetyltransferase [Betaproteobacteria bacterium]|nr:GNAT family N-acetyltransferase [Betaproteobacteria bacterium]
MGTWESLKRLAFPVREAVFVREQGVPVEIEQDEWDARALHAVALLNGSVVGTGRLLPDGHIGRLAVLQRARGFGVGKALISALMEEARKSGMQSVALHAQTHATSFYVAMGFRREGEEFIEAGIPHIAMQRPL